MTGQRLLAVALLLVSCTSCTKNYYPNPAAPTPVETPPPPPPPVVHTLEFRVESVLGVTEDAQITYGTSLDGTSSVRTALPWTVRVTMKDPSNLFVHLQAVTNDQAYVRVQIVVDGQVFREASGWSPAVSGTIRL